MLGLTFLPQSKIESFQNENKARLDLIFNDNLPSFNLEGNKELAKKMYEETEIYAKISRINDMVSNCLYESTEDKDIIEMINAIRDFDKTIYTMIILAIHGFLQAKNLDCLAEFMNELKTFTASEVDASCNIMDESEDTNIENFVETDIDTAEQAVIFDENNTIEEE